MSEKTICDECGKEIDIEYGGPVYHQIRSYGNGWVEDTHFCNDCVGKNDWSMVEMVREHLPW